MNKYFNIFNIFFLLFVFTTSIDSFPNRNLFKKHEPFGKFIQFPGNFPVTVNSNTYTPIILVPGKNMTHHVNWTNTIELVKGTIGVLEVYHNNDLLYKYEEDFCVAMEKFGFKCPIPPGTYDMVITYEFYYSPDQPKNVIDEYLIHYLSKLSNIIFAH